MEETIVQISQQGKKTWITPKVELISILGGPLATVESATSSGKHGSIS
jgi:hypothetical protein